jgi:hypothetical protein
VVHCYYDLWNFQNIKKQKSLNQKKINIWKVFWSETKRRKRWKTKEKKNIKNILMVFFDPKQKEWGERQKQEEEKKDLNGF